MTNEEALAHLKLHDYWTQFSWQDEVCEVAISALESIDKIKAERDAAVNELKENLCSCYYCKSYDRNPLSPFCEEYDICSRGNGEADRWEWRGVQE